MLPFKSNHKMVVYQVCGLLLDQPILMPSVNRDRET